jgi:hypothetical protein
LRGIEGTRALGVEGVVVQLVDLRQVRREHLNQRHQH